MEKFLESLESQLSILNESERKRIIKRYQIELEEKMKDGMSEKEAIQSLGSMDSVLNSIYKEYHLNEQYSKESKGLGGKVNSILRSCAVFLSDNCAEIAYYVTHVSNKSLEVFFEIFLKILLLVIVFLILKLPFLLLENFCNFAFSFLFYPFDSMLSILSEFIIGVIYLMLCISLSIYMFKGYAKSSEKKEEKEKIEKKEKVKSSEEARNFAYIILKVILYIIAIIPLILLSIIFLALTVLAFFLVYKGVNIIGLAVLLIGILFLNIIVTTYITDALDNHSRSHTLALIVAIIALISGSILLFDNLMSFHYFKTLEESSFQPIVENLTIDVNQELDVINFQGNVEFIVDNDIQDNEVILELEYYDSLYDVHVEKDNSSLMVFTVRDDFEISNIYYLYNNGLEDLKNGKVYDYRTLNTVNIKIYGNEETKKLLQIH